MRVVRWADPSNTGDPRKHTLQEIWLWVREELEQENGGRKFQGNCPEGEKVLARSADSSLGDAKLDNWTESLSCLLPRPIPIPPCTPLLLLNLGSTVDHEMNASKPGQKVGTARPFAQTSFYLSQLATYIVWVKATWNLSTGFHDSRKCYQTMSRLLPTDRDKSECSAFMVGRVWEGRGEDSALLHDDQVRWWRQWIHCFSF